MKVQFHLSWILRSTTFAAIGLWALTWPFSYPHMTLATVWIAPAAFGGSIGALFGHTVHGVFGGLVALVLLIAILFLVAYAADVANIP
jgi:hypothetical protein